MLEFLTQTAKQAADFAFWYCVDFMVNVARLTHSSYLEANTWVLLLLIPILFVFLISLKAVQHRQLRTLRLIRRTQAE